MGFAPRAAKGWVLAMLAFFVRLRVALVPLSAFGLATPTLAERQAQQKHLLGQYQFDHQPNTGQAHPGV